MCSRSLSVPHISVTVHENDLQGGALKILKVLRPTWNAGNVQFKLLTDGITNKLLGCKPDDLDEDETVLIRIYGKKTELVIDRETEKRNIIFLNKLKLAPDLYATHNNGLVYQYVPGCTLTVDSVIKPNIYSLVAKKMAQLHKANINEGNSHEPIIWDKIRKFLNTVSDKFSDEQKQLRFEKICTPLKKIANEVEELQEILSNTTNPVVFAHNDLLLGNVIYTENTHSVTFIDYEYAGLNYQAFDIANHFAEFGGLDGCDYSRYPKKELQTDWIHIYLNEFLGRQPLEKEVETLYVQVNKFVLLSHLLWGTWALIQAEHSDNEFDYLGYGALRYNEYFARKANFLSLKLPD